MTLNNANLVLSGANGKMGLMLQNLKHQYFEGQVYDAKTADFDSIKKPIVWIDFSHTSTFESVIAGLKKLQCPLVMGTTGLTKQQFQALRILGKHLPILYDTNFSMGIQVLRKLVQALPQTASFDISIFESHHRPKIDKPSGTAKTLQTDLKERFGESTPIDILSHRGGGIFGEHQIILSGLHEKITLTHEAFDRTVFAEGALQAAQWLLQQQFGFYSMKDLLR